MICVECGFPSSAEHDCACAVYARAEAAEERLAAIVARIPNASVIPWEHAGQWWRERNGVVGPYVEDGLRERFGNPIADSLASKP